MQKFTFNGKHLCQFGSEVNTKGQLQYPLGITVHNNRVYVADQVNRRVLVFYCDGKFSHIIRSNQLTSSFDVAINDKNQLFVANWAHHCIFIFTLDDNYVGRIGTRGSGKGQLNLASGVAVNKEGYVFVGEAGNCRVSIFSKEQTFIHSFGSRGSAKGQFNTNESLGIALSPDGNVYISDYSNKRIQIYSDF